MTTAIICPSMLSCDFAKLASEAQLMIDNGADWLHMDVMDGHFVPNITIGPIIIKSLRKHMKTAFLDCHLMVSDPLKWIEPFANAGADLISYHFETQHSLEQHRTVIEAIKAHKMKVSIAIKPKTPLSRENESKQDEPSVIEVINHFRKDLHQILVMTVEPGFGGQKFMVDMMPKVQQLRQLLPDINIQVDGGVNVETIQQAAKSGANVIVSGSGVFKYPTVQQPDYKQAIAIMRNAVNDNIQNRNQNQK